MPTTARLVGAITLAALAWYVSTLIVPLLPEGRDIGFFVEINTVIGLMCGWTVMGSRAGEGISNAIGFGLTGAAALMFWGLFLHSSGEMIRKSLRKNYDGPMEAVVSVFEMMVEFGQMIATPQVFITVLVGGVVAGLITEFFGSRYS